MQISVGKASIFGGFKQCGRPEQVSEAHQGVSVFGLSFIAIAVY